MLSPNGNESRISSSPRKFFDAHVLDHRGQPVHLGLQQGALVLDLEHRQTADQCADTLDRFQRGDGGLQIDRAPLQLFERVARAQMDNVGQGRRELGRLADNDVPDHA